MAKLCINFAYKMSFVNNLHIARTEIVKCSNFDHIVDDREFRNVVCKLRVAFLVDTLYLKVLSGAPCTYYGALIVYNSW